VPSGSSSPTLGGEREGLADVWPAGIRRGRWRDIIEDRGIGSGNAERTDVFGL